MSYNAQEVVGRRPIFANNFRSISDPTSDLTVVKERVKLADGTERPVLSLKKDEQRPFWVEKKANQVYKDKKENRPKSEMDEFWCTQAELPYKVGRALGMYGKFDPNPRKLARSPYVYGLDCDVTVHTMQRLTTYYNEKYGAFNPNLTMAVLDYETNMYSEDEEIIMGSVTMKDKCITVVDRNWLNWAGDEKADTVDCLEKYLGDIAKERGIDLNETIVFVDSEIEIVQLCFQRLHELMPDVCSIWNITFDIDKTLEACQRAGVPPEDVFCDPNIPEEFRTMYWKKDENNKQKADGSSSTKDPADKWHWMRAPASFQFIDNMCAFRMFRAMEQKMSSYSLDSVLDTVFKGKVRKMKFKEAAHVVENSPDWHRFMQKNYKLEYIAYNLFDCIVMELLDEKAKDISHKLLSYVGITNWARAKSNPTRLCDAYHFFLGKFDRVLCSTSDKMRHVFDDLTLPKTGWIVTLDNTLIDVKEMGYNPFVAANDSCYNENGDNVYELFTKAATHTYDIDVSSSYPSNESALNVNRDTTLVEVCQIEGLSVREHQDLSVDLMNARGNAAKICEKLFKLPTGEQLLEEFQRELDKAA